MAPFSKSPSRWTHVFLADEDARGQVRIRAGAGGAEWEVVSFQASFSRTAVAPGTLCLISTPAYHGSSSLQRYQCYHFWSPQQTFQGEVAMPILQTREWSSGPQVSWVPAQMLHLWWSLLIPKVGSLAYFLAYFHTIHLSVKVLEWLNDICHMSESFFFSVHTET